MRTFHFTGLANEAAITIEDQIDVLTKNGVFATELRRVDGRDILTHSEAELAHIKNVVDDAGFTVFSIATPIGKTPIEEDFQKTVEELNKAVYAAKLMGCRYIRIFSFYIPEGKCADDYADEALFRLSEMTKIAEKNDLILALENESRLFGESLDHIDQIFTTIHSPYLRQIFDGGNFLRDGVCPYPQAFQRSWKNIEYFHIKDMKASNRTQFVPVGEGDTHVGEMLQEAYERGFDGWLSIEPHLTYRRDLSMARQFTTAANALKRTLNEYLGANLQEVDLNLFD